MMRREDYLRAITLVVVLVGAWSEPAASISVAKKGEEGERDGVVVHIDSFLHNTNQEYDKIVSFLDKYKKTREDSGCCEDEREQDVDRFTDLKEAFSFARISMTRLEDVLRSFVSHIESYNCDTCPPPTKDSCHPSERRCESGECVPRTSFCDETTNCEDGSDEDPDICSPNCEYRCVGENQCLPMSRRCDGLVDCPYADDETNCNFTTTTTAPPQKDQPLSQECEDDQFLCGTRNKCVLTRWLCDGNRDCPDGSDEVNCNSTSPSEPNTITVQPAVTTVEPSVCASNEFLCEVDMECLSNSWICDGDQDCADGSDEYNCIDKCEDDQFLCGTRNKCVLTRWLCDGNRDCPDGSDEVNCNSTSPSEPNTITVQPAVTTVEPSVCASNEFLCEVDMECLSNSWICDGDQDCADGSDEYNCIDKCEDDQFLCGTRNKCVLTRWLCDGNRDCPDGSDEVNCNSTSPSEPNTITVQPAVTTVEPSVCASNEFLCEVDMECLSNSWICDGDQDCADGSDEYNCIDKCEDDQFLCGTRNKCVLTRWLCDGNRDCPDGSDEVNCNSTSPSEPNTITVQPAVTTTPRMVCTPDQFQCESGDVCIQLSWQCDGVPDCFDKSDEKNCGNDVCQNNLCSHTCVPSPSDQDSYMCICPVGYVLVRDRHTCIECHEEHPIIEGEIGSSKGGVKGRVKG
ncbi:hypothetical protein Pmani_015265 [Petrolisthes manimaculis]|uniref:EGF-like domain-containing protein n=1 Tax=Petrolisthes manimaculis TaxID=1843537 RepID=A0AAE1U7J0_9EUCA|nr:hypothetical protein Pmani_015265 [Petrolisthes manimaculis]